MCHWLGVTLASKHFLFKAGICLEDEAEIGYGCDHSFSVEKLALSLVPYNGHL